MDSRKALISIIFKDEMRSEEFLQIVRCNTEDLKAEYASVFCDLEKEIAQYSLKGDPKVITAVNENIESNRAVKLVKTVREGNCRCSYYFSSELVPLLPKDEEENGLIKILSTKDIPWQSEHICECTDCGKKFNVREEHGYHYPQSNWREIT